MSTYLDYNASTPVDERVLNVMVDVYRNAYGNADNMNNTFGEKASSVVDKARGQVAGLLGIKKDEVFFTSGATESDNMVVFGLVNYARQTGKKHIVTTAIEHKAVLQPLGELEKQGFEVTYISPDESGRVSADDVLNAVREDTLLVSVMHANNETGIIQPVKEIGDALSGRDIFFHVDAAQTFGKLVEELRGVKYTFLSASAHKMYGPQGVGVLVMRKKRYKLPPLTPMFFGGSQEHGFRPGTVPTALIAGMGEACRIAEKEYADNLKKYEETKQMIYQLLEQSGISYSVNGDRKYCIPNTLNVRLDGMNSVALMQYCKQFCGMSNGSACNAASHEPSHVLKAMGFSDEHTEQSIRLSWGNGAFDTEDFVRMLEVAKSWT